MWRRFREPNLSSFQRSHMNATIHVSCGDDWLPYLYLAIMYMQCHDLMSLSPATSCLICGSGFSKASFEEGNSDPSGEPHLVARRPHRDVNFSQVPRSLGEPKSICDFILVRCTLGNKPYETPQARYCGMVMGGLTTPHQRTIHHHKGYCKRVESSNLELHNEERLSQPRHITSQEMT